MEGALHLPGTVVIRDAHTRRQILKAAIGGAAGLVLGAPIRGLAAAAQTAAAITVTGQLSDDLFLLRLPGEANVLAQTGSGGVLLVDGGSAKAADALTAHVSGLPGGGPVHTIFNTHWHPEQTGSNERLGKSGATIIAQENTKLWLTTDVTWSWNGQRFKRLPKIAQPNKTFYTTGTLESGIQYGYIPDAAHTDGDLYVYFPKQNVLAVGDVVSGEGWPVVDWQTGGWIGGMVRGIETLIAAADEATIIVPADGPPLTRQDLVKQRDMYVAIMGRLKTMMESGFSADKALQLTAALLEQGVQVALLEQPVPKDDWDGMHQVTQWGGIPVAADETATDARAALRIVQERAAQVVNIKLMKCGIVEALDIAAICRAARLRLMIGGMVESILAMSASACFAAGQGGFSFVDLDTPLFMAENPFDGGMIYQGARIELGQIQAGHGVTPKAFI